MERFTIGVADITIGGNKVPNQADAAVFTAEPILLDVDLYQVPNYDKILEGYNVQVQIVVDEDCIQGYEMALAGMEVVDSEILVNPPIGLYDGGNQQSMRSKAKEVIIHPVAFGEDDSYDIIIHKAIPIGSFERTYGKEKTSYTITLQGLAKTANVKDVNQYFQIGKIEE